MPKLSVIKETENNCDNVVYINGACEMKKEIGVPENFRLKIQSSPFKCDTSAFIKNISLIASGIPSGKAIKAGWTLTRIPSQAKSRTPLWI